jgi:hypothetical protein
MLYQPKVFFCGDRLMMKAIFCFVLAVLMGGQLALHSTNGLEHKPWDPLHKFSSPDRVGFHPHDIVASIDSNTPSTEIIFHHIHDSLEEPNLTRLFGTTNIQTERESFIESSPKNNFDNLFGRLLRPPRTFS